MAKTAMRESLDKAQEKGEVRQFGKLLADIGRGAEFAAYSKLAEKAVEKNPDSKFYKKFMALLDRVEALNEDSEAQDEEIKRAIESDLFLTEAFRELDPEDMVEVLGAERVAEKTIGFLRNSFNLDDKTAKRIFKDPSVNTLVMKKFNRHVKDIYAVSDEIAASSTDIDPGDLENMDFDVKLLKFLHEECNDRMKYGEQPLAFAWLLRYVSRWRPAFKQRGDGMTTYADGGIDRRIFEEGALINILPELAESLRPHRDQADLIETLVRKHGSYVRQDFPERMEQVKTAVGQILGEERASALFDESR